MRVIEESSIRPHGSSRSLPSLCTALSKLITAKGHFTPLVPLALPLLLAILCSSITDSNSLQATEASFTPLAVSSNASDLESRECRKGQTAKLFFSTFDIFTELYNSLSPSTLIR
uniref:Uncharacterized protein n=1 Tax=Opuntia streptacantha TaxID=393608 RepID=A0A7C9F5U1_OPUST